MIEQCRVCKRIRCRKNDYTSEWQGVDRMTRLDALCKMLKIKVDNELTCDDCIKEYEAITGYA